MVGRLCHRFKALRRFLSRTDAAAGRLRALAIPPLRPIWRRKYARNAKVHERWCSGASHRSFALEQPVLKERLDLGDPRLVLDHDQLERERFQVGVKDARAERQFAVAAAVRFRGRQ